MVVINLMVSFGFFLMPFLGFGTSCSECFLCTFLFYINKSSFLIKKKIPTLVGGDFNEVLALSEVKEGSDRCRVAMMGFNDVLNRCFLQDMGFVVV